MAITSCTEEELPRVTWGQWELKIPFSFPNYCAKGHMDEDSHILEAKLYQEDPPTPSQTNSSFQQSTRS